ncbi:MAG: DUF2301 domain-containing membrane protein [Leptolyngbyaceae cyanobacterium CSU_1_3]|nr:DUF2301 domain-containing membrane protein [Leptolyngbyaceae cyanobacterium CSU_1_3]
MTQTTTPLEVYQGQFGNFTITEDDRRSVIVYRGGLVVAALSFAIATALVFWQGASAVSLLTWLYGCFWVALGVSLGMVHIYLKPLHRALQAFWAIGGAVSLGLALRSGEPLALQVYQHPVTILGIGFTFAALTGIFFKEAFCFNRFETKFLTAIVPLLLLGHLLGWLPIVGEQGLLAGWAALFVVFAIRKVIQPIPPDIGDKSVFEYLKQARS